MRHPHAGSGSGRLTFGMREALLPHTTSDPCGWSAGRHGGNAVMTVKPKLDSKTVADQARARGAYAHVVDTAQHPDRGSTLNAIAAALSLPDHFGRNLDTLYDGLTDLSWLPPGEHVLIWRASEVLKRSDLKSYLAVHSVLSDAQRALTPRAGRRDGRQLTVVLAD